MLQPDPQTIINRLSSGWTFKPRYVHMAQLTRPSGKGSMSITRGQMKDTITLLQKYIDEISACLPGKYANSDHQWQKPQ